MKKRSDLQSFLGTTLRHRGFAGATTLVAFLFLLGTGGNQSVAEDTVSGGVSAEQNTDDNVSADTDVTTSGDTGDCRVSAHASASSTSNGETVSRQSDKTVEGPCGKASAKASASSSNKSGGTANKGN